jgi:hypothetical protein
MSEPHREQACDCRNDFAELASLFLDCFYQSVQAREDELRFSMQCVRFF